MKPTKFAVYALALAASSSARAINNVRAVPAPVQGDSSHDSLADAPPPATSSSNAWADHPAPSSTKESWSDAAAPTTHSPNKWADSPAPTTSSSSAWEDAQAACSSSSSGWQGAPAPAPSSSKGWQDAPAPTSSASSGWADSPAPSGSSSGSSYTVYWNTEWQGTAQQYSHYSDARGFIDVTVQSDEVLRYVQIVNPADNANCVVKDKQGNQVRAFGGPAQEVDSVGFDGNDAKQAVSVSCELAK